LKALRLLAMLPAKKKVVADAALLEAIRMAKFEPHHFAEKILNLQRLEGEPLPGSSNYNPDLDWQLDEWQKELICAVSDVHRKRLGMPTFYNHDGKQYITCRACQGPGKTFGIALLAHIFGFAYDPVVICVMAPKLEHIKTRFFGEFEKIRMRAMEGYSSLMEVTATRVIWKSGSPANHFLQAETGAQPENVQGLRRRFTLYLVDESAGLSEKIFPVMSGNINATEIGIVVLIGNPNRLLGTFADSHLKPQFSRDFYRMHVDPSKSRRVKASDVERLVRLYGENSDITRVRAYGLFPLADSNQLIALEWLLAAQERETTPDGSLPKIRVAVDVADGGSAETVCSAAYHYQSIMVPIIERRFSFPAHMSPILAAKAARQLYIDVGGEPKRGDDIVVDADGVGSGTAGWLLTDNEALVNGTRPNIIAYRGGHSSDQPKLWRNRRVQSHLVMRNRFRDGLIAFASTYAADEDWDGLFGQICMNRRKLGTERVEDLVSKQELVDMGLISPDRSDALAMHFATQTPALSIDKEHRPRTEDQITVVNTSITEEIEF
jgi:hypothetical protein